MVKVHGPMFSLEASGTIGKAATFSKWKGRPYVRARVVPANPKSGLQVGVRTMFKFLSQMWADSVLTADKATWDDMAKASVISNFNAYMGANQSRWRNRKGPSKATPANEDDATPAAFAIAVTGGVRQVLCAMTYDNLRMGWGATIYRSKTTPFTEALSNCIAVVELDAAPGTDYTDTPLAAGTYYYRAGGFTGEGKTWPVGDIFEATVTDV